jgi:general secretion pathway protein C
MLANRSSLSRFAIPQTSAEWEPLFARCLAVIAKVPLSTWQFIVRLLLVVILSLSLARLFWLLFPTPVLPKAVVAIATASGAVASNNSSGSSVNIAQLKALSLFGKADAPKQDQPAAISSQVVDTSLSLTLVGVMESSDDNSARAIIASGDRQEVYAVNAPLPVGSNVTLFKVMNDRVIINNNGQQESLWLYKNDQHPQTYQPAQYSQNTAVEPQTIQSPQPIATKPADLPSGRISTYGPEAQSPARAGGDPALAEVSRNLADVVAMSIHRENGQVIGYKIRPGRDAERFRAAGLQADDVVTAINGMPLTNPAKIMEIYKNMGNTTSASLEIKRGASVINVNVEIQ